VPFLIGLLVLFVVLLIAYVALAVNVVRPYQKGVVERLGKYKDTADPGLRFILPFIESLRKVDMREQVIDVPPQEVITQDNVTAAVDAVVYFEPTDPQRLLYNISNFILAITKLAQTNLRNVIGEMSLDEAFTSRERVNSTLRQILDDATDKWGVRVVRVEIQRIDPPTDVMNAMHEQMKAERTRRAVVTEAEGSREAAVTRAEGEKTAAILRAEGQREKDILNAEGEAVGVRTRAEAEQFRQEVVAQGEANAITNVFGAIINSGADDRVIALKYLESLEAIANGQATKIFVPADMSATLGAIGGIAEMIKDGGGPGAGIITDRPEVPAAAGITSTMARAASAPVSRTVAQQRGDANAGGAARPAPAARPRPAARPAPRPEPDDQPPPPQN
jgi:regulator of protease activity HflC (stomatin/prohibitin superfamily)